MPLSSTRLAEKGRRIGKAMAEIQGKAKQKNTPIDGCISGEGSGVRNVNNVVPDLMKVISVKTSELSVEMCCSEKLPTDEVLFVL
jgi:hypothetical protein